MPIPRAPSFPPGCRPRVKPLFTSARDTHRIIIGHTHQIHQRCENFARRHDEEKRRDEGRKEKKDRQGEKEHSPWLSPVVDKYRRKVVKGKMKRERERYRL